MQKILIAAAGVFAAVLGTLTLVNAQGAAAADEVKYAANGDLARPADYRDWVYLSTGLNMTYGAQARPADRNQPFNNVFVNRESYKRFLETGSWPEKTIFILEIRQSEQHVRPNAFGYTQAAVTGMEA